MVLLLSLIWAAQLSELKDLRIGDAQGRLRAFESALTQEGVSVADATVIGTERQRSDATAHFLDFLLIQITSASAGKYTIVLVHVVLLF
jgi:hypothetical protein